MRMDVDGVELGNNGPALLRIKMSRATINRIGALVAANAARDAYNYGKRYIGSYFRSRSIRGIPSMPYRRTFATRGRSRKRAYSRYGRSRRRYKKRSFRRKATRNIGVNIGFGNCKRALTANTVGQQIFNMTLYSRDLTWIERADDGLNSINERQREMINLRGFKIHMAINNDPGGKGDRIWHCAIISPKGSFGFFGPQDNCVAGDNFFRGNGVNRAINFQSSLTGIERNVLSINTDAYSILFHKRFYFENTDTNGKRSKFLKLWVPLKRQVTYDGIPQAQAGRCALVWWFEPVQGVGPSSTPVAYADLDLHCITYFKEVCC